MHLGILQCGHTSPEISARFGSYGDMFDRLLAGRGLRTTKWDVVDMEFPVAVDEAEAWLLTGSRHGVYEDHAFIPPLERFIREARDAGVPMLGICFGHQIIARALGGRVEKFSGGWQLGRTDYHIEGLGGVPLLAWHQDQVLAPPADARVIARGPGCERAGFAIGDSILTLQPHPEFTTAIVSAMLRLRRDDPAYPPARLEAAAASLPGPLGSARVADWLADFLARAVEARNGGGDTLERHG